jgi:hypothetical protein
MTGHWLLAAVQEPLSVEEVPAVNMTVLVICIALILVLLVAMWRVYEKAGEPGWAGILPVVNVFFLARAVGKPMWWGILGLVPIVNLIVWFILCIRLAKRFGRGTGFGIGLVLFSIIFWPILAFGDAEAGPIPA